LKLRTKFLLSFLLVSSALTCATLLVLRREFQCEIKSTMHIHLRDSVVAFQNFEHDRRENLTRSAELLANLPNLKALMTSSDPATIQDGSGELWPLVGSDLMVITDRSGAVVGVHATAGDVPNQLAQKWVAQSTGAGHSEQWWFLSGHLFEIFPRPIYSGSREDSRFLGTLFVGWEVNDKVANDIMGIAGTQIIVTYGDAVAASTIRDNPRHLAERVVGAGSRDHPQRLQIAGRQFLSAAVNFTTQPVAVRLVVLESLERELSFLRSINELLLLLGLAANFVGCAIIYLISRRFTRPLERLVACANALGDHDFSYPLEESGADEISNLTHAFIDMRTRLKAAQSTALESERMATIGRMASSISHDLRHRLTAIVAYTEFLSTGPLAAEKRAEMYAEVSTAARQMTDLLESMVDLSRTHGALKLELIDIRDVLEEAIRAIRTDPKFRHIPIGIDAGQESAGHFDPRRLERVFYNILLNACEVLPQNTGQIRASVRAEEDRVEIRISDTGPGIPASIRETIFQPFVSFGKQRGSGLGLAIVQKTCHDHGGEVWIESADPGKTTFTIVLPRTNQMAAAVAIGASVRKTV
jgi:signal transduction histidine kinase